MHAALIGEHAHPGDGHLVGGEGAGLVGADDGRAAEGLHRGQGAHDGVLLGHPAGAQSEASGDDGRQTLGDGGHGQGDGDLEVVDGALDPGAAVCRVVEVADVDGPHSHTDDRDHLVDDENTKL